MSVHYEGHGVVLHHGDCLDVLRTLPDNSVDSVVTDPPYGLEFMGKDWDAPWKASGTVLHDPSEVGGFQDGNGGNAFSRSRVRYGREGGDSRAFGEWCELWTAECLRVLKPGGHLLAFGGTRTWHRLACAVEDAGFEVRDSIAWLYGSGFPKSLDVSKAIDKAAGAEREVVGVKPDQLARKAGEIRRGESMWRTRNEEIDPGRGGYTDPMAAALITAPATDAAREWEGWGTALKPAFEPVVVARKPLVGTVAGNVLTHGTGALNIDACRIEHDAGVNLDREQRQSSETAGFGSSGMKAGHVQPLYAPGGRWPANVVLDDSQAEVLDEQSGTSFSTKRGAHNDKDRPGETVAYGRIPSARYAEGSTHADSGGASRFFKVVEADERGAISPHFPRDFDPPFLYQAKAPKRERPVVDGVAHPTVKPLTLMRWLVRLVTPPGGTVLEPFAGSGATVEACIIEGFDCIAIEKGAEYLPLIMQRIHRRRDPVEVIKLAAEDLGLFGLGERA